MNKILIGCEAFIKKENSILLGMRENCFGEGTWALPGGHLEFQEKAIECLWREMKEELGVDFSKNKFHFVSVVDDFGENSEKHYVHLSFEIEYKGEEIKLMEADKCSEWKFFDLNKLPENIFIAHEKIIENYLQGKIY